MAWKTDTQSGIAVRYHYDAVDRVARYTETGLGYSHSVSYTYNDVLNKPATMVETINGVSLATSYVYNDRNMISVCTVGNIQVTYGYDTFDRLTTKYTEVPNGAMIVEAYTYKVNADGKATNQIATYSVTANNQTTTYAYTYDDNGNIKTVTVGGKTTTYTYDRLNQLTREDNEAGGYSCEWEYDEAGNIVACYKYNYTTGNLGSVQAFVDYYYEDYDWGDLLTYCNYGFDNYGARVSHDDIGNMLSDGERTYTWRNGRELATLTKDGKTWNFTYDADGMRVRRTYGNTVYRYTYNGGLLTQMTVDICVTTSVEYTLFFTYDASGKPVSVTYNGTTYYYVTNLQGDVVAILNSSGATVVTYTYDVWGKLLSTTDTTDENLGYHNPIRYRGYIYDNETGLYYLQSRYYNPEIGRFISADGLVSTGQGLLGYNMFAYCGNNPVMGYDPSGEINWHGLVAGIAIVGIGAIFVVAAFSTGGASLSATGMFATAAKAVALAVGTSIVVTGATVMYGATTEEPVVFDASAVDGNTHDKNGYSVVVDFDSESVLFDIYSHYGKTTAGYSVSYGSGKVYNYEKPGDYGGVFVDANGSFKVMGMDYGVDVCADPFDPVNGCKAILITVGYSFSTSKFGGSVGVDYYVPISSFEIRWD